MIEDMKTDDGMRADERWRETGTTGGFMMGKMMMYNDIQAAEKYKLT